MSTCSIKRFIQKAQNIRISHSLNKDIQLEGDYHKNLKILCDSIDNSGTFSLLIKAIQVIAYRVLKNYKHELFIHRQREGEHGEGLSGDAVFFAYNRHGERLLVIKAYSLEKERFEQGFYEIMGIATLKELDLPHINSVKVRSISSCFVRNVRYFIVAQSIASGFDIDWYIAALFKSKSRSTSKIRELQLFTCMDHLGKSIATIHNAYKQNGQESNDFSWYYREHFKNNLDIFLKAHANGVLKTHANLAIIATIKDLFYLSLERCVNEYTQEDSGIFHGDVWFSNILFDSNTNKISLIDSAGIARSLDKNRKPWGLPGYDYTLIVHNLELKRCFATNQYHKDLLGNLIECFYSSYRESGGRLPKHNAEFFYRLTMSLEYCGWFGLFLEKSSLRKKKFIQSLIQCNFDHILSLIA